MSRHDDLPDVIYGLEAQLAPAIHVTFRATGRSLNQSAEYSYWTEN